MTDLFEPLRDRLRQLGWCQVQRWKLTLWKRADGAEFAEDEAFKQLPPVDEPGIDLAGDRAS